MYTYDPPALARVIIDERIREASHRRLAREFQRRERPSTTSSAVQKPRRPSRLWSLVHVRQAYS